MVFDNEHLNRKEAILFVRTTSALLGPLYAQYFKPYRQENKLNEPVHSVSEELFLSRSLNLDAIVGLLRISFLIVISCALSFAIRRLRSVPSKASLVFYKWSIDLSISPIAVLNFLDARS
jgi:hypothetical protein